MNSTRGTLEEISLQGLQPGALYRVRVVAHNEHGPGMSSQELQLTTQSEVAVPGRPLQPTARPTSSFSILVSWAPPAGLGETVTQYTLYHRRVSYTPQQMRSLLLPNRSFHSHALGIGNHDIMISAHLSSDWQPTHQPPANYHDRTTTH